MPAPRPSERSASAIADVQSRLAAAVDCAVQAQWGFAPADETSSDGLQGDPTQSDTAFDLAMRTLFADTTLSDDEIGIFLRDLLERTQAFRMPSEPGDAVLARTDAWLIANAIRSTIADIGSYDNLAQTLDGLCEDASPLATLHDGPSNRVARVLAATNLGLEALLALKRHAGQVMEESQREPYQMLLQAGAALADAGALPPPNFRLTTSRGSGAGTRIESGGNRR